MFPGVVAPHLGGRLAVDPNQVAARREVRGHLEGGLNPLERLARGPQGDGQEHRLAGRHATGDDLALDDARRAKLGHSGDADLGPDGLEGEQGPEEGRIQHPAHLCGARATDVLRTGEHILPVDEVATLGPEAHRQVGGAGPHAIEDAISGRDGRGGGGLAEDLRRGHEFQGQVGRYPAGVAHGDNGRGQPRLPPELDDQPYAPIFNDSADGRADGVAHGEGDLVRGDDGAHLRADHGILARPLVEELVAQDESPVALHHGDGAVGGDVYRPAGELHAYRVARPEVTGRLGCGLADAAPEQPPQWVAGGDAHGQPQGWQPCRRTGGCRKQRFQEHSRSRVAVVRVRVGDRVGEDGR